MKSIFDKIILDSAIYAKLKRKRRTNLHYLIKTHKFGPADSPTLDFTHRVTCRPGRVKVTQNVKTSDITNCLSNAGDVPQKRPIFFECATESSWRDLDILLKSGHIQVVLHMTFILHTTLHADLRV